jgi:hypothetical protein
MSKNAGTSRCAELSRRDGSHAIDAVAHTVARAAARAVSIAASTAVGQAGGVLLIETVRCGFGRRVVGGSGALA